MKQARTQKQGRDKKSSKDTEDDLVVFSSESGRKPETRNSAFEALLLIVDDEAEIHTMTKMVLADYVFNGVSLNFLSAYSASEAKEIMRTHNDIACVLLDVVMETQDAGLEVARYIRQDLKNDRIRIILRTGQPGKAPEKEVILNYDINDYKEKTELTNQKLFTTITTALRSYYHLVDLDKKNREIAKKNDRLNREIARRIVAETSLKKYNKTLEALIETKSSQLKTAIQKLDRQQAMAAATAMSASSISQIQDTNGKVKQNLDTINQYRAHMNLLLGKYDMLHHIITLHADKTKSITRPDTAAILSDIHQFKKDQRFDHIMEHYPRIIHDSREGLETIARTIEELQQFLDRAEEKKTPARVNSLLETAVKKVQKEFNDNIDVQWFLSELPDVKLMAATMEQAFYEIIKNAFQAVSPKGIVCVSSAVFGKEVTITVSDLGCGMSPETLDMVFVPGTEKKGMGLCFAKNIIDRNNGRIAIESTENEGTSVIVSMDI